MRKRNIVRLVSFLAAAVVVLSGFMIKEIEKNNNLVLQIENNYSKNLNDFSASLNNISLLLKKVRYSNSAGSLNRLATELLTATEISKNALAQFPDGSHFSELNRFLSQVGNYAFAVSNKLYNGEEPPEDYKNNIMELSETAQKIADIVNTAKTDYDNAEYWTGEIKQEVDKADKTLSASLQEIEGEFSDTPTLIYDGPYSDHLLNVKSELIESGAPILESEALDIAASFADLEKEELKLKAREKGKIEVFHFGGDEVDISVSQRGGHVVYMRKTRQVNDSIISYNQAIEKAKRFLGAKGLDSFIETYYFADEGVCVINFAYLDGQTICYTDLIKVGVAMDNGEIVFYEAGGFIANHKPRAFETAVYTPEQASQKVSNELKILKISMALIPTNKENEERCYEFVCTDGENEVLVYINTLDLSEEEILILLKNDGGTLVK